MLTVVPLENDEPTYALLEVIHEYAAELIDQTGRPTDARQAHASFFAKLAGEFPNHFFEPDQVWWMSRCWSEIENFNAAVRWMLEQGQAAEAFDLVASLRWLYGTKGRSREFLDLIESIGEEFAGSDRRRADRALCRGSALSNLMNLEDAQDELEFAADRYADIGCSEAAVEATYELARVFSCRQEHEQAERAYLHVREIAGTCDLAHLERLAVHGRGCVALATGEEETAEDCLKMALSEFESVGDRRSAAQAKANLGIAYYRRGELSTARDLFGEAAGELQETGDISTALNVYSNLGFLLKHMGQFEEAQRVFRSLHSVSLTTARSEMQAVALSGIADCMVEVWERALPYLTRMGDPEELARAESAFADARGDEKERR